ncbi:hypothetical protein FNV43_RR01628 [Rhamnella rubrinervis]|uniref:Uncharacterized protein n=1 Tax=Rhamnella rubrinervis TaxID=2594499 RepID=A0A8K0HQ64_9ROSA|nr:hypothetical protein FNV43_RR01628 [Rhamnella rubrinervis]
MLGRPRCRIGWAAGWRWAVRWRCMSCGMVVCVCVLALRIESLGAALSLCYGTCGLEPPGFLCRIPNVMELVANGVPFLSRLARAREDAKVAHAAPAPLKIILWPPRPRGAYSPLDANTRAAFMAFQRPKIALSLGSIPREPEKRLPHPRKARSAKKLPNPDTGRISSYSLAFWIGVMITGHGAFRFHSRVGAQDDRYRPSLNYKRCHCGSADVAYRTHAPYEKSKSWVPGSMVARLKLKGIDGRAPLSGAGLI